MGEHEIEMIKAVTNAGTFGLNVMIIVGLFFLVNRWAGGMIAALRELAAAFAKLSEKIDSLTKENKK